MKLLSKISSNKIFVLYIFLHILFFNINFAEWGDSYRILRASEFVRTFSYPEDEKRAPFYSIILALRPNTVDQVVWARLIMFFVSLLLFWVFSKFLDLKKIEGEKKDLALLLFALNPVLLYWSLRVMADIPFLLLTLISFYFLEKKNKYLFLSGIFSGLAVLTRFEGYILGFSIGLGLLLTRENIIVKIKNLLLYGSGALLLMSPWLVYRNPLTSTYFEEPSNRAYDIKTVVIFFSSLLFIFGFTSAFYFIYNKKGFIRKFILDNSALSIFIGIELLLILLWPAAIPRIFVPIIPFLIIPLAVGIVDYFKTGSKAAVYFCGTLLLAYIPLQFWIRQQFLIVNKYYFVVAILLQLALIVILHFRNYRLFKYTLLLSMFLWTLSTIHLHKDVFRPLVVANKHIIENYSGRFAYNDVSSVSDWYMNQRSNEDNVEGKYVYLDSKESRKFKNLKKLNIDYLLLTNEHNIDLDFNFKDAPYLEELEKFEYFNRGKVFFAKIVRFNQNYETDH